MPRRPDTEKVAAIVRDAGGLSGRNGLARSRGRYRQVQAREGAERPHRECQDALSPTSTNRYAEAAAADRLTAAAGLLARRLTTYNERRRTLCGLGLAA